jgi:hypothetical protein
MSLVQVLYSRPLFDGLKLPGKSESLMIWTTLAPKVGFCSSFWHRRLPCKSYQPNQFSGAVRRPLQRMVRPCRIAPGRSGPTSPRAHTLRQRADLLGHLAWQEQAMQPT